MRDTQKDIISPDLSAHDQISAACALLRQITYALGGMADSFHDVGNKDVSRRLVDMSVHVEQAQDVIRKAAFDLAYQACQDSQKATTNMIGAVLAVLDKAPR